MHFDICNVVRTYLTVVVFGPEEMFQAVDDDNWQKWAQRQV